MPPKQKTSVSLSEDALALLEGLSRKLGLNKSGVLELAVRRMAEAEGVKASADE